MAELASNMLLGPLISTLSQKASKCLTEQYDAMAGMEEQLAVLERKLPAILDVIADAEEQGAHRAGVGAWLKALKAVAYEANDAFDEFKYEELRREAKKKGHNSILGMDVVSLFPAHNPIVFRYRMGNKLRRIVQAMEVLVTEMNAFGFRYQRQARASKQCRQTDSIIDDSEKDIVEKSRHEEKKKIVQILLDHAGNEEKKKKKKIGQILLDQANNRDLMVLPIVGMGGLGKTTFAQLVYNDTEIQKHFQLQRWICVSDDFDVVNLANKICDKEEKDREKALEKLQQEVSGKRYLIVLDDVWERDPDKWGKLKTCLQHGATGSAILTTTRDKKVAQIMGTVDEHKLGMLEKRFLKEIFERRAFSLQEQRPRKLVDIVDKIVDRCAGSPLAAKALGSVLSTKTSVEEWEAVLSKSNILDDDNIILPILKISYNDLPLHMKQCFAFCAVFPKDYVIDVESLIQLWMANEFIPPQQGIRLETTGHQIFNELAWRSFFQDVEQSRSLHSWGRLSFTTKCNIHDLMHDVALSVMGKECATITEEPSYNELLTNLTRHLFFSSFDKGALLDDFWTKRSPNVQTILRDNFSFVSMPHFSKRSSLRAFHFPRGKTRPIRPRHLQHLRYLDLSSNGAIKELPEEISILYNLQTLNLSGCKKLGGLPKNMKYMTGLRHLYTNGCVSLKCMPPDLGQLTSLQTLTYFVVGASSLPCSNIGELHNLSLGGELELHCLENVTEAHARAANLGNKGRLTQLSLEWNSDCHIKELDYHQKVLDALKPHGGLQMLRIVSYKSTGLPTWMKDLSVLQGLIELHLVDCTICEEFPQFWHLKALQVLYLIGLDKLQSLSNNMASTAFPALKELKLHNLKSLERLVIVEGRQGEEPNFPLLEKVHIENCPNLTTLLEAPNLSVLELEEARPRCNNMASMTFPALKKLKLHCLMSLERWVAVEGSQGEKLTFPLLEKVDIENCPKLTTLPEAPKIKLLNLEEAKPQLSLSIVKSRYMCSLSNLTLSVKDSETTLQFDQNCLELADGGEMLNHEACLSEMTLRGCDFFFPATPAQPTIRIWRWFVHLEALEIRSCDLLIYWPEREFLSLVSLKRLLVLSCEKLIGPTQVEGEPTLAKDQLLPQLEILRIFNCGSLTELFDLPSSLRSISIHRCDSLEFIWGKKDRGSESVAVEHPNRFTTLEDCNGLLESSNLQEQSSMTRNHFLPCLQNLYISCCGNLVGVPNLPPSLRSLSILFCGELHFLSGQLDELMNLNIHTCNKLESLEYLGHFPSLESLVLERCKHLISLPNGLGRNTVLQRITIKYCPVINIKPLHERLQQRFNSFEVRDLSNTHSNDPQEGPKLRDPKSWKYVFSGCKDG